MASDSHSVTSIVYVEFKFEQKYRLLILILLIKRNQETTSIFSLPLCIGTLSLCLRDLVGCDDHFRIPTLDLQKCLCSISRYSKEWGVTASQLDQPSLTPLSVAGCGRLQMGVAFWVFR